MSAALQNLMLQVNSASQITLLLAVAAMMYKKRLHRETPTFFAYVLFDCFGMAIISVLRNLGLAHAYWYGAWAESTGCIVLEFAVLSEVFDRLFASYTGIRRLAKSIVWWTATVIFVLAALTVTFFHQVNYTTPLLTALLMMQRSLAVVQLGVVLGLFAVSGYLHLRWRNFIFGIALGFGFHALMTLLGNIIRVQYGQMLAGTVGVFEASEYCFAVVIWLCYTLQPDIAAVPVVNVPSHELEQWDLALTRLLRYPQSSSAAAAGK